MSFTIKAALASMQRAARQAAGAESESAQRTIRRAIASEQSFLDSLVSARLAGDIDDGGFRRQLRAERTMLVDLVLEDADATRDGAEGAIAAALTVLDGQIVRAVASAAARRPPTKARKTATAATKHKHNVRPDTVDFRDLMYVPNLVEVSERIPLEAYLKRRVPVLDQGEEGACTGFGLATVAHFLLRTRRVDPDPERVSARMLYAMARRYDEWRGENYDGSSCRGAMKGWHKHGICTDRLWPHDPANPDDTLTEARSASAQRRPLGAYFRVNHKDLVAMHAAITEVGVLFASATVHPGWDNVGASGIIPTDAMNVDDGGHAFAIVGYDERGYWIQNSWGDRWGKGGCGLIAYDDWMRNASDVWVARLAVPIRTSGSRAATHAAFSVSSRAKAYAYDEVRPHVISLGNDGEPRPGGNIGTTPAAIEQIIRKDIRRITEKWKRRRIVLYAHGGLVPEDSAVQRVSDYRAVMLKAECYPLAFVWNSDYWSTITNILTEALSLRKPEGVIAGVKDFLMDRLDDALEPIARKLTGKSAWDEMKENASLATESLNGGARLVADELARLSQESSAKVELHLVGHSAGAILLAGLVRHLTLPPPEGLGMPVSSCTLWAPACTTSLFHHAYRPAIESGAIDRFAIYTLTDECERGDHCARVYNKSLLYLVSNAFERRPRIPFLRPDGEPLLGMEKFLNVDRDIQRLIRNKQMEHVRAPNAEGEGSFGASTVSAHGGFDDDKPTVLSTLARILNTTSKTRNASRTLVFRPGLQRTQSQRQLLSAVGNGVGRVPG
jgi:hypothetical protein